MAKLERPTVVPRLRPSMSSCITMAVDDKVRHAPRTIDADTELPNLKAITPMIVAVISTCRLPSPNTSRRMAHRRSNDSSSPIMNRRNMMPSSASAFTLFGDDTV